MIYKNQYGITLIISIFILFSLTIIGLISVKATVTDIIISGNMKDIKRAYYIAEAGIRHSTEYLKHNLTDWDVYTTQQILLDKTEFAKGSYCVTIEDAGNRRRKIVSIGTTGNGAVARIETIFVPLCYITSHFNLGIFGDQQLSIDGASFLDSYDSSVALYNEGSRYTNCDIGTNATGGDSIILNATKVYGDAYVGCGGDPNTDITKTGTAKVMGEESSLERPKDIKTIIDTGGGTPETLHLVTGNKTFSSGTYRLPYIRINNGEGIIDGKVTFYVDGIIDISANGKIIILPDASLKICASGDISITGKGIINQTYIPKNFLIYGTSGCTNISISGIFDIFAGIYAPEADIDITGISQVYGAILGNSVTLVGTADIHYDEAMQDIGKECKIYDFRLISYRSI